MFVPPMSNTPALAAGFSSLADMVRFMGEVFRVYTELLVRNVIIKIHLFIESNGRSPVWTHEHTLPIDGQMEPAIASIGAASPLPILPRSLLARNSHVG